MQRLLPKLFIALLLSLQVVWVAHAIEIGGDQHDHASGDCVLCLHAEQNQPWPASGAYQTSTPTFCNTAIIARPTVTPEPFNVWMKRGLPSSLR